MQAISCDFRFYNWNARMKKVARRYFKGLQKVWEIFVEMD